MLRDNLFTLEMNASLEIQFKSHHSERKLNTLKG